MTMKAKRKLLGIKPNEVSIVDRPANLTKFLTMKAADGKMELVITSDGTVAGTMIKVNGEEVKGLTNLSVWYNSPLPGQPEKGIYPALSCSYSKVVEMADGFARTETFTLNKGDCIMDKELEAMLKAYFGDKWEIVKKDLSADAVKAIKEAVTMVNKYKDEFPEELKKAVGVLADYASSGYGYGSPKSDDGDKTQKNQQTNVNNQQNTDQAAFETLKTELTTAIGTLTKAVNDGTEANKKLVADVDSLSKRLETIEKTTPVRKGIEGQDDNQNQNNQGGTVDNFPSIPI